MRPFARFVLLTATALSTLACPTLAGAQTTPPGQEAGNGQNTPATQQLPGDGSAGGAPAEPAAEAEEIVVVGQRLPGAVEGDVKPEVQLSPSEIRAYGASNIAELIAALSPLTDSGRGRGGGPVFLLNGRRIGSPREISSIPSEALVRVDILPPEAALAYGYGADQRVVNFVVRQRFRSLSVELADTVPTEGGTNAIRAEATLTQIRPSGRNNIEVEYNRQTPLLESERGLISTRGGQFDRLGNVTGIGGAQIDPALSALVGEPVTIAGVPVTAATAAPTLNDFVAGANDPNTTDITPFRTLRSASDSIEGNAVIARTLFGDIDTTFTVGSQLTDTTAQQGLAQATLTVPRSNPFSPFDSDVRLLRTLGEEALLAKSRTWEVNGAVSMNGTIPGNWRWSFNGNVERTERSGTTDRGFAIAPVQAALTAGDPGVNPFGPLLPLAPIIDTNREVRNALSGDAVVSGAAFRLPAGDVRTNIRLRANSSSIDSRSVRSGIEQVASRGRDEVTGRIGINVPIASDRENVLPFLGRLSFNAAGGVTELSDFSRLVEYSYGLNWDPVPILSIRASFAGDQNAPSQNQLAAPVIVTPNVVVFDFVRGESVAVTATTGGNPDLRADNRRSFSLGGNLRLLDANNTRIDVNMDYTRDRIDDPTQGFPAITAAIAQAFPERFTRDATGRLLAIDTRAVNFDRSERQELRTRISFNKSFPAPRGRGDDERWRQMVGQGQPGGEGPPRGDGGQQGQAGPRGEGGQRGPGGGFGGGGGGRFGGRGGGNSIGIDLTHTYRLAQTLLIREGLPELDLLNGDAQNSRGGSPRHEVRVQARGRYNGFNFRLEGNYAGPTFVNGGVAADGRLDFSSLTRFNAQAQVDLGQSFIARGERWARNARVSLNVTNLFNTRQRVTDANGEVPLTYQPGFVDPLGRTVSITLRKLFS
ncbi:TonB-dependent receptor [Sphingomonas sp. BGYR3]|uniref:TonB-dependent receptor n=1 Tax=Sphingomonas sp. BGYR3 TaxID=2975483 RepID=UPI0021A4FF18|nr:TonB-dependent receptor [Sphingomonas sp. BGYR3]MDG5488966.1 TonB-dependent receptor [Sphingomonas sp. BGYR3]